MVHIQYFVFTSLILVTSGTDDVGFLIGVPRLNNNSYWDYYFHCTSTGQTLQWYVNNSALGELSQVADVVSGTKSDFKFVATTLSLKPTSQGDFGHTSLLIVSCLGNCDLDVTCTNGLSNMTIKNMENGLDVNSKANDTSVLLEYVLTENILGQGTSECTNIFICGVNNRFMTLKVIEDGFNDLSFTIDDPFGHNRRTLQGNGNTVRQQGILIGHQPYSLVTAWIVVDGSDALTVSCGYVLNEVNLTIEKLPTTTIDSKPEIFSTSSTRSETTTDIIAGVDVGAAIAGTIITVLVITAGIVVIIIVLIYYLKYQNEQRDENPKEKRYQAKDIRRLPSSNEPPLNINHCSHTKTLKNDIQYYINFGEKVEYVFTILGEEVLTAATTVITAPEEGSEHMTAITSDVYVGKIGDHAVGLIQSESEETLVRDISTWFKNIKYLISVGYCCAFDFTEIFLGDVLISDSISMFTLTNKEHEFILNIKMEKDVKNIFTSNYNEAKGLPVTSDRSANHYVGKLACGPKTEGNLPLVSSDAVGYKHVTGYPVRLQLDGITMPDGQRKSIQYIAIEGVVGYVGEEERDDWKFMSSQAAFDYVANTIRAMPDPNE